MNVGLDDRPYRKTKIIYMNLKQGFETQISAVVSRRLAFYWRSMLALRA